MYTDYEIVCKVRSTISAPQPSIRLLISRYSLFRPTFPHSSCVIPSSGDAIPISKPSVTSSSVNPRA